MSLMPFKVALFVAHPGAMPSLNSLMTQGRLAGVVIPPEQEIFFQQLEQWLRDQQVPCFRLNYAEEHATVDVLKQWEAELIVAFGFSGDVPQSLLEATTFGYYNLLLADPEQYCGGFPLYWQIRQGQKSGKIALQKVAAIDENAKIAATAEYDIGPLDTYKLVENTAATKAAQCVSEFVRHIADGGEPALTDCNRAGKVCTIPTEQALSISFSTMSARQIADMARAGNPVFNGCIIRLGQTPLSLLQATEADFPTYGVAPGTICHSGEPDGVIVATADGALRLDVIANMDGVFSANAFLERFQISAGMAFS